METLPRHSRTDIPASLLGLATALFLDWLKTRREEKNIIKEREEKELALLNSTNTSIGFNISVLTHAVMQQILPHHEQSHAACVAIMALHGDASRLEQFEELLHSQFQPMMKRCPELYLEDVNLPKDLPFLIAKDPDLIMLSGWITTYMQHLKSILSERNRLIDIVTIENAKDGLDLPSLERQIATQATIADVEVVNAYQLFQQLASVSQKIEKIIGDKYKDVVGPKLKIRPPDAFDEIMTELERLSHNIVKDWPPSEPTAT